VADDMNFKPINWNGVPIPHDTPVTDLRAMVEHPGPEAWAAFRALAARPETEALAILVETVRSSDPHLRRSAVEAIGIHPNGRTACDVVCQLLHDRDNFVVRAAVDAAAKLRLDTAHEQILELVKSSEANTQLAALRALESLGQPSDFAAVFDLYLNDPSETVQKQAAWALQTIVSAEYWAQLFSVWSKDPMPRHPVWACQLAERFGDNAVLPALEALQVDHDGHVCCAAGQAADRISGG
jgi:HEAT repeat protein